VLLKSSGISKDDVLGNSEAVLDCLNFNDQLNKNTDPSGGGGTRTSSYPEEKQVNLRKCVYDDCCRGPSVP